MAQADPGQSRSLKEILEENRGEQGGGKSKQLEEKLQEKEKELEKHKEKVKELEAEKIKEKVEVVTEVQEKELVKERGPVEKKTEAEGEDSSKAAKAQKTSLKKGIADDIAYVQELDEPKQVKALVYMALKKGIHHAYDVARGLKSPYLLDKFHDALIDKVRDTLVKKGKLKKSYRQEGDEK